MKTIKETYQRNDKINALLFIVGLNDFRKMSFIYL